MPPRAPTARGTDPFHDPLGTVVQLARRALAPRRRRRERIVSGALVGRPGEAIHLIDRGQGPEVVLLHGLGGLAQEVFAPLHPLARRCRVVAFDRPGYGRSDPLPPEEMAPDRQARWLRRALAAAGVRRPVLVAHSIAAATALRFALAHPNRLAGLVLVAPFCRPTRPSAMPLLRAAVAPVVGTVLRDAVVPVLAPLLAPERIAAAFAPHPVPASMRHYPVSLAVRPDSMLAMAGELNGFNAAMVPVRDALRSLPVPTVVIVGEDDTVAPADRHGAWLASRLPRVELIRVAGAGHMLHHLRPDLVMAAARTLAGIPVRRPSSNRPSGAPSREFSRTSLELAAQEE